MKKLKVLGMVSAGILAMATATITATSVFAADTSTKDNITTVDSISDTKVNINNNILDLSIILDTFLSNRM